MRPTGPVRALAGLPRAAERQIIGTRKPVIRGIPIKAGPVGVEAMALQQGWRWCRKCQGLFFARNPTQGESVPADRKPHNNTGSGAYVLHHQSSPIPGQDGWAWCPACQGLYFRYGGPGVCPAGNQGHGYVEGSDYVLLGAPGVGQNGWSWCQNCQGLHFAAAGLGPCPAGEQHSSLGSGDYVLSGEEDTGFIPPNLTLDPTDPLATVRNAVQGTSWVNVQSPFGVIGQIYFPTDVAALDFADMAELEKIVQAYPAPLNVRPVHFEFFGFADYRSTKEYNFVLWQRRAQVVRDFIVEQMFLVALPIRTFSLQP